MPIPTSYFVVQAKIPKIMEAIQKAGVPEKFTLGFVRSLGFKSTNDRPILAVLKSFGFLNQNAVPTDLYKAYKNPSKSKKMLGKSLKETYSDIFLADEKANTLSVEKLKGIFATVSGKSDSVASKMASTFKSFCNIAEFNDLENVDTEQDAVKESIKENIGESTPSISRIKKNADFHYNIQIHLPATRDITVYNAIFKSLKEHLL